MATTQLLHFVSAAGLNIPVLSAKRVAEYEAAGLLQEPLDVFTLEQKPYAQLARAEARMEAAALPLEQVLTGIAAVLPLSLPTFLQALGIPQVGIVEIEALAKRVRSFDGLLALRATEQDNLPTDVIPERWARLIGFLTTERHQQKLHAFGAVVPFRPYQELPATVSAPPRTRVLIIGAGLSGGQLGCRLLQESPNLEVRVLDEGAEPGGRMLSRPLPNSDWALEFGAGRFNQQQHRRMNSLVEKFKLPVAPFLTDQSSTRLRNPRITAPMKILNKALLGSSTTGQMRTPFLDYAHERLSPRDLDYVVAAQGYDVLLNPQLPASEVVRILDDHPETSESESEWVRIVPGFQELVKSLHREIAQRGGTHRFHSRVTSIERLPGHRLRAHCEDGQVEEADHIFLTVPKIGLEQIDLPPDAGRRKAIQSIEPVPLMKAFFLFEEDWWNDLEVENDSVMITDNPLRKVYFRPGHIVVYNDSSTARYWEPLCSERAASSGLLWRAVSNYLHELLDLPAAVTFPAPKQHLSKFWPAGVYFWKVGVNPEAVQRELMAPHDNLHICSEAYSPHSGWGEAALSSVELLLELLSQSQRLPHNAQAY